MEKPLVEVVDPNESAPKDKDQDQDQVAPAPMAPSAGQE